MAISKEFFRIEMSRLERQFNGGKPLDELLQKEYFMTMNLFTEEDVSAAFDEIIQTHKPYPGNLFPSIASIIDALDSVMKNTSKEKEEDQIESDFCEKCRNSGTYLPMTHGDARFCDCMKGRRKEIDFLYWPNKKRIAAEKEKIRGAAPAHRGLKERDPNGFYTDTQEEHDKWMAAKRAEIDEFASKRAEHRGLGAGAIENAAMGLLGPLLGVVKGVLGQVSEVRKAIDNEIDAERPL